MELEICAGYFTGSSCLVPPLAHRAELRIIWGLNYPDATTMSRAGVDVPQDKEEKRGFVKICHAVRVVGVRARFDNPVETRCVDGLPRVSTLDIRAVGEIRTLLALNAIDPSENTYYNLGPPPSIHRNRMPGPPRYLHDGKEGLVVMIEKPERHVNHRWLFALHISS